MTEVFWSPEQGKTASRFQELQAKVDALPIASGVTLIQAQVDCIRDRDRFVIEDPNLRLKIFPIVDKRIENAIAEIATASDRYEAISQIRDRLVETRQIERDISRSVMVRPFWEEAKYAGVITFYYARALDRLEAELAIKDGFPMDLGTLRVVTPASWEWQIPHDLDQKLARAAAPSTTRLTAPGFTGQEAINEAFIGEKSYDDLMKKAFNLWQISDLDGMGLVSRGDWFKILPEQEKETLRLIGILARGSAKIKAGSSSLDVLFLKQERLDDFKAAPEVVVLSKSEVTEILRTKGVWEYLVAYAQVLTTKEKFDVYLSGSGESLNEVSDLEKWKMIRLQIREKVRIAKGLTEKEAETAEIMAYLFLHNGHFAEGIGGKIGLDEVGIQEIYYFFRPRERALARLSAGKGWGTFSDWMLAHRDNPETKNQLAKAVPETIGESFFDYVGKRDKDGKVIKSFGEMLIEGGSVDDAISCLEEAPFKQYYIRQGKRKGLLEAFFKAPAIKSRSASSALGEQIGAEVVKVLSTAEERDERIQNQLILAWYHDPRSSKLKLPISPLDLLGFPAFITGLRSAGVRNFNLSFLN